MISDKEILLEKEFQNKLKKIFKKKASYHPEGEIRFKYQYGKHRPYIKDCNGKRYIKAENKSLISSLLKKKIDNRILEHIECNINMLDAMTINFKGIEWILGDKTIKGIEEEIGKGFKVSDFLAESHKQYRMAEFHTENKIYTTPAGIVVRSKAELIIGTFLEMKGIPYI